MKQIVVMSSLLLLVVLVPVEAQLAPSLSPDQEMELMAREIPGFGGLFYDADGVPHVFLVDPGQEDQVRAFGESVVVHQGQFDFAQLQAWRETLRSTLVLDGVTTLDVDETRNRVVVGVDPARFDRGHGLVTREIGRAGIPPAAVLIEAQEPFEPLSHTVQDTFRPVPGGVEIGFAGAFVCTVGFNVAFSDGTNGFVTNSHCTLIQGGTEGTVYTQNFFGGRIGVEVFDPTYGPIPGCPGGAVCRTSDSALAFYDVASTAQVGNIARTFLNALNINHNNPRFLIAATGAGLTGQTINKVGRTTGWTRGSQTNTCVDIGVSGTNIVLLCQNLVSAGLGGGDSGSPVFRRSGGSNVTLVGLLWGGNGAGTLFAYSPISAVCTELFGAPC